MKTKARDLIHGWPHPHSTTRPYIEPRTPLIQVEIASFPEIPAEAFTYLKMLDEAMTDLCGAPIVIRESEPHARAIAGMLRFRP